jgi:hypothetical protein
LLATCSVFVGGWTEAAAAAVGDLGDSSLDALSSLMENSLVTRMRAPGGARFTMLEPIREYAATLFDATAERAARRRHADFNVALAERLSPQLFGSEGRAAREDLATEIPNMEAAYRWSIGGREIDTALRFAWALRWAWELSAGYLEAGRSLSEETIALSLDRSLARARAIHATANQAWSASDPSRARELWEEALSIYREVEDEEGIASLLGNLAEYAPNPDAQAAMYREALAISTRIGDVPAQTNTLHNIGIVELMRGNADEARNWIQEGVDLGIRSGDDVHVARGNLTLAEICLHDGDVDAALDFIGRAKAAAGAGDVTFLTVTATAIESQIEGARGADDRAADLLNEALAADVGDFRSATVAYVAEALAPILARAGRSIDAARVLGMADSWMVQMGWRVNAPLRAETTTRLVEPARTTLGEEAFETERAAGRQLSADLHAAEVSRLLGELASTPPTRSPASRSPSF